MDVPASMNGHHFQAPSAVGQSLPPACAAELSEDGEMFDSYDDDNLSSPSRIRTPPKPLKQVADLNRDDDGDSEGGDGDHTEVSWLRTIRTAQHRVRLIPSFLIDRIQVADPNSVSPSPPSLPKSPIHTADDFTTSSTAVTPGGKRHPLKMCVELFFLCYRSSADRVPSYSRTSDLCHGDCRRYSPSASILHSKYRLYRNKASIIVLRREIGKGLIPSYLAATWPD
jgi:hypothetical protein